MDVLALLGSAAAGAVIGFLAKVTVEVLGRRHQIRTRWDAQLLTLSIEFSATARQLLNNAEAGVPIEQQHDRLRTLSEQLRLIGNTEVQKTSRSVVHHAYSVHRKARSVPRDARDRYLATLDRFYIACRKQLRVRNPEDVDRNEPADAAS